MSDAAISGGKWTVPVLPPLPGVLIEEHGDRHRTLASGIEALPVELQAVFRRFQRRLLGEAFANANVDDVVLPRRRRQLAPDSSARVGACAISLSHVDSRLEMFRRQLVPELVSASTPTVLHALAECRSVHGRETNPGLVRASANGFADGDQSFAPPPPDRCASLLGAAVDLVNRAPAPAVTRAGWMCLTLMSIHPFVDGNGRTARLLHQLIVGEDLPGGWDWATVEYWATHRDEYIAALHASTDPSRPAYRGDLIEPEHFMRFAAESSIRAAGRVVERIEVIERAWRSEWESPGPLHRQIEVAVWADGTATLDELTELVDDPLCTTIVSELVGDERLRWGSGGLLVLGADHPLRAIAVD